VHKYRECLDFIGRDFPELSLGRCGLGEVRSGGRARPAVAVPTCVSKVDFVFWMILVIEC
jgi:hypothetical protein